MQIIKSFIAAAIIATILASCATGSDTATTTRPTTTIEGKIIDAVTITAPPTTAPTTAAPTTAAPTAPPTTRSVAVDLGDWYIANGDSMTAVQTALTTMTDAANDSDIVALYAACTDLADAVDDAQSRPAIPANEANGYYQSGLTNLADGAAGCLDGDLDTAINSIAAGAEDISRASDALSRYL